MSGSAFGSVAAAFALAALLPWGCHRQAQTAPIAKPRVSAPEAISWLDDDYPAARARAIEEHKPLLIDMWAPWCHTCLSMKHFVLTDASIVALGERFVWLAVDTDREVNAEVVGRYAVTLWPTFLVISPETQKVESRLVGSGTVREFRDFLERGERGFLATRDEAGKLPDGPLRHMRDGDRAAAAKDWAAADVAYGKALASGQLGERVPDVLLAMIGGRYKAEDHAGCVHLAEARLADAARGRSAKAADFAAYADICASKLGDAPEAKRIREAIVAEDSPVRAVLMDPESPLSTDDRSDGLRILRDVHDALGQKDQGAALAERQLALLEEAIARAPDAHAAMTFNWPLAEVCVRLGRPAAAVPALERSIAALPDEYDPLYRLAWVLLQDERPREALPRAEAALARVYGPRKGRVQALLADIHEALGDVEAERKAREAVVAIYEGLPSGQADPKALAAAREALAEMTAGD